MTKRKRISLWAAGAIGILLALLLILILLLPKILNLEPVREKILTNISQQVGGKLEFQRVDLSFFPRPCVVIHQGSLSIPGKIAGTLGSLTIYPEILPLLKARVRIAMLQVEAPEAKMELPERLEEKSARPKTFSFETIRKELAPLFGHLEAKAPGLVVNVDKGRLDIAQENVSVFWFQDIQARIGLPPDKFKIDLTCKSNLWESISLEGWLDSNDFAGKGSIDLAHFHLQELTDYLLPPTAPRIIDSQVDLDLSLEIDGLKAFRAEVQGSIPYLALHHADERLVIKGKSLKGDLHVDEKTATLS